MFLVWRQKESAHLPMEGYHGASTPLFKAPSFVQPLLTGGVQPRALAAILWKHDGESEMASQKRQQYSICAQDGAGSGV